MTVLANKHLQNTDRQPLEGIYQALNYLLETWEEKQWIHLLYWCFQIFEAHHFFFDVSKVSFLCPSF